MSSTFLAKTQESRASSGEYSRPAASRENSYTRLVPAPTLKQLGQRIAEWRAEKELDQGEFGRLIGKSQRTVSSIEGGKVTLRVLLTTMDKLGKDFGDLEPGPAEKRLGTPRSDPAAPGDAVPLRFHLAALAALERAERVIQTLERTRVPGDLSLPVLAGIREQAEEEAAAMQQPRGAAAQPARDNRGNKRRGTAGKKVRP